MDAKAANCSGAEEIVAHAGPNEETTTMLTDLNDDCLEEIFMFFTNQDLVSIAEAHPRFEAVAAKVYSRKYSKLSYFFFNEKRRNKQHLRLFRQFGHTIEELFFRATLAKFDFRLLDAMAKHCGESLTSLEIQFDGSSMTHVTGKKYCRIFLQQLSKKFPKLQCLSYEPGQMRYFQRLEHIVQRFPSLMHLSIDLHEHSIEQFKQIIRLNPQLEGLGVRFNDVTLSQDLVAFLDERLPILQSLSFTCKNVEQVETFQPRHFQFLGRLFINVPDLTAALKVLSVSSIMLERLFNFSFTHFIETPVDILLQYKLLRELRVHLLNDDDLIKLATNLPNIERCFITSADAITAPAIVRVVNRLPKLNLLVFYFNLLQVDDIFVDHVKAGLSNVKWKITRERLYTMDDLKIERNKAQ